MQAEGKILNMILFILNVWFTNAFEEHFNKVENKEITPTHAEK